MPDKSNRYTRLNSLNIFPQEMANPPATQGSTYLGPGTGIPENPWTPQRGAFWNRRAYFTSGNNVASIQENVKWTVATIPIESINGDPSLQTAGSELKRAWWPTAAYISGVVYPENSTTLSVQGVAGGIDLVPFQFEYLTTWNYGVTIDSGAKLQSYTTFFPLGGFFNPFYGGGDLNTPGAINWYNSLIGVAGGTDNPTYNNQVNIHLGQAYGGGLYNQTVIEVNVGLNVMGTISGSPGYVYASGTYILL